MSFVDSPVTVIVTCWRRFENLRRIIDAWLDDERVTELILWDNSQDNGNPHATSTAALLDDLWEDERVWLIRSSLNYGSSARYALAALAKNEVLLFGDDDVLPKPNLITHLLDTHWGDRHRMVGIRGRNWFGNAYDAHVDVHGQDLDEPQEVDMLVGYIMLTHRSLLLGFNFSEAAHTCCELELFGRIRERQGAWPSLQLLVAPTSCFEQLPEGEDPATALYLQPHAHTEKAAVWARYYQNQPTHRWVPA